MSFMSGIFANYLHLHLLAVTPLNNIPDDLLSTPNIKTRPNTQHGLSLLWHAVRYNTYELVQQMRSEGDSWYCSVLDECRDGCLSADNHAFLHYQDTSVPGSWDFCTNSTKCHICNKLVEKTPSEIRAQECEVCHDERLRRARVIGSIPQDTRMQDSFSDAVSIVANNDMKYDICKRRAAEFARNTGEPIFLLYHVYSTNCT